MVVGEAPGEVELVRRQPFIGPTGRVFWTAAQAAGIDRGDCYVTNVIHAAPEGASGSPSSSQITAEWARLDGELAGAQCRVLVLVGGVALKRVMGLSSITNMRGYLLRPADAQSALRPQQVQLGVYRTSKAGKYSKGDPRYAVRRLPSPRVLPPHVKWIIAVLHPAGIMRTGMRTLPALRADLERAGRAMRDEVHPIGPENVKVATQPAMRMQGDFIAVDIETPQPPNDWVVERVGAASELGEVWSAPWSDVARSALISCGPGYIVFHNAAFDVPRLAAAGVRFDGYKLWDTMLAAQLLNPDLPKGLARAATVLLDLRPWKHLFDAEPHIYNGLDAFNTAFLAEAQHARIKATEQLPVFETMMLAQPVLMRLHERGIMVDTEYKRTWCEDLARQLEVLFNDWPEPSVSPGSPKQLASYLYDKLRLPRQFGKHGGATTDAEAIAYMQHNLTLTAEQERVLALLGKIRQVQMDLKVYAGVELTGSRVHPSYLPASKDEADADFSRRGQGAGTGRQIARDPNIQNQNDAARCLYIPSGGGCLGYVDWSQAELRYDAARAGDIALLAACDAKGGVPAVIATALAVDRVRAKNLVYGTRNAAGPRTIAKAMRAAGFDVKEEEIKAQQARMLGLFPKWAARRQAVMHEGAAKGYVTNAFGRRRYFYQRSEGTRMIGFDAQSGVADMLYRVLPEAERVTTLLALIYDGILFEAPAQEIQAQAALLQAVMEQEFPEVAAGFRIPVSVKIGLPGESWGAMEARYEEMKNG